MRSPQLTRTKKIVVKEIQGSKLTIPVTPYEVERWQQLAELEDTTTNEFIRKAVRSYINLYHS